MRSRYHHISIALPVMAELENVPKLLELLRHQTFRDFDLYVCVNQPEDGWEFSDSDRRRQVCVENQEVLRILKGVQDFPVIVLDKSSRGHGWQGSRHGVGWARKLLFESISAHCADDELVVSMDADIMFSDDYLLCLLQMVCRYPQAEALCLPYYHPLSGMTAMQRSLLRYECYMRYYLIQMLRIGNPYAFTAIGSAMAFPLWAYRRVGGITPLQGGEDFYLMQKFAKTGTILLPAEQSLCVFPQGRKSFRVPFGTGPAVAMGVEELSVRYPFYSAQAFDEVRDTFAMFPALYEFDVETPMSKFLCSQLKVSDLWGALRRNFKRQDLFVRACRERIDGLRILQYLRSRPYSQEELFYEGQNVDFLSDSIARLDSFRESLFKQEMMLREHQSMLGI